MYYKFNKIERTFLYFLLTTFESTKFLFVRNQINYKFINIEK